MQKYRFINCNKCATLVEDVDIGEGYSCLGAEGIWKISLPSSQFYRESKTSLKIVVKKSVRLVLIIG